MNENSLFSFAKPLFPAYFPAAQSRKNSRKIEGNPLLSPRMDFPSFYYYAAVRVMFSLYVF